MSSGDSTSELGRRLAAIQDRQIAQRRPVPTKQRLLSDADDRRRSPARSRSLALAAAAAAALLVSLVLWVAPYGASRSLEATLADGERVEVGRWLGATSAPLDLAFSDGTKVVLASGSSARVASIDEAGARVVVERGHVDVDVAHVAGARWVFDVGPFTVMVTGTRFRAGWSPETGRFTLDLIEGSVAVSGPIVGESRAVTRGEALRVSVPEGEMALSNVPAPEPIMTAGAPATARASGSSEAPPVELSSLPSIHRPQTPPSATSVASSAPAAIDAAPVDSWRSLAKAGKYKDALAQAEKAGLDAILESATADELALLADAARLAGKADTAVRALSAQRRRFKGEAQASGAAFMLGRAAFDDDKDYAAAAKWFATYLEEQPGGTFAREALGRLIEARRLGGDRTGARSAARSYLKAYPDGPHADIARSILGT